MQFEQLCHLQPLTMPTPQCSTCDDTGVIVTTEPARTLFTPGNTRVVESRVPCPDCQNTATLAPSVPLSAPEPERC